MTGFLSLAELMISQLFNLMIRLTYGKVAATRIGRESFSVRTNILFCYSEDLRTKPCSSGHLTRQHLDG
jgi:hypothetical protein